MLYLCAWYHQQQSLLSMCMTNTINLKKLKRPIFWNERSPCFFLETEGVLVNAPYNALGMFMSFFRKKKRSCICPYFRSSEARCIIFPIKIVPKYSDTVILICSKQKRTYKEYVTVSQLATFLGDVGVNFILNFNFLTYSLYLIF